MEEARKQGFQVDCERPEEEVSFDESVCSAEFPKGCIKSASEQKESQE